MDETDWKKMSVWLTPDQVVRVDEWRRRQANLPARNEAIRALLDIALKAEGVGESPPGADVK